MLHGLRLGAKSRADFAIVLSAVIALALSGGSGVLAPEYAQRMAQSKAQSMAQSEAGAVSSRRLLTTQNEASPTAAPPIASMNDAV
jgi:hypothetical protein